MNRFLAILLIVAIVAGAVGYVVINARHEKELSAVRAAAEGRVEAETRRAHEISEDLAVDLARVMATTLADDVARQEGAAIEAQLAAAVKGHRIAGVIVLSPEGDVLAATDMRYSGRRLEDPNTLAALRATKAAAAEQPPAPGQLEVHAPIVNAGNQVGALRLFLDTGS